ncbi:MAG: endonuclease/exonuclease/phosphatase family protein [Bacteroidota bacterium]
MHLRSLAPLVLLFVLAGCAGCSGSSISLPLASGFEVEPPPTFKTDGLRLATLNTEFMFDGDDEEGAAGFDWKGDPVASQAHRARVGRLVQMLDADLVMLQEVENQRALDMLIDEQLEGLGYTGVLVNGTDTFTRQNVALLTRLPIEEAGRTDVRVPVGAMSEQTYGVSKNLWVRLTLPGGTPATLIGVHFLARPDDTTRKDRREAQAEVIRRLVVREQDAGRVVAVLGDFNDFDAAVRDARGSQPITDVLTRIRSADPADATDDLTNVMGEVPQRRRFTALYDRNGNGAVDRGELSAIDHILLGPAMYAALREVTYVHSHDPLVAPDHFPVVVTLGQVER